MQDRYQPGDPVIFSVSKSSTHPGPRAEEIHPAAHGDTYSYLVPKYWRIVERRPDGSLVLLTRRGKRRTVQVGDPRLRPPTLWERWFHGHRFPPRFGRHEPDDANGVLQDAASR